MRLMRVAPMIVLLALSPSVGWAGQHGGHPAPPQHPPSQGHNQEAVPHAPVTVPQKIAANPALSTRLQPLLPTGMTLADAAAGFKNQGQFIAALHVSRNLGIPFASLKNEMTGPDRLSLGQSIQKLRPSADVKRATKRAQQEADDDLKSSDK